MEEARAHHPQGEDLTRLDALEARVRGELSVLRAKAWMSVHGDTKKKEKEEKKEEEEEEESGEGGEEEEGIENVALPRRLAYARGSSTKVADGHSRMSYGICPVKPLVFDLALNEISYPSLDERVKKSKGFFSFW